MAAHTATIHVLRRRPRALAMDLTFEQVSVLGQIRTMVERFTGTRWERVKCTALEPDREAQTIATVFLLRHPDLLLPDEWVRMYLGVSAEELVQLEHDALTSLTTRRSWHTGIMISIICQGVGIEPSELLKNRPSE